MKNAKKVLLLVLCAVLLVGASVAGTLAYLTSQDTVTNTFTVGNVIITLDEAKVDEYGKLLYKTDEANKFATTGTELADRVDENSYKLIPGHTYTKDPTIHVAEDSEACWLFVKIENGNDNATINGLVENGWTQIEQSQYWAYKGATVGANSSIPVFNSFTYGSSVANTSSDADTKIIVTAYAIQADGFETADAAWAALATQLQLK